MSRRPTLLGDLVSRIADAGRGLMAAPPPPDLHGMCETLLTGRGEATGLALGRAVLERYEKLDDDARLAFFADLRDSFGPDAAAVEAAIAQWRETEGDAALRALHAAAEPRSQELFRRLNRAPGGTRMLVSMRRDLLRLGRGDASFRALDDDFRHLLGSWFNRGFLELRRIDWSTSAEVLERIIRYEAVHEIADWDDLRRRVAAPDRRLYAFFHPALREDPLIFVEVALTGKIPGSIGAILARERKAMVPAEAEVAVFYSISNCQDGLRGISFGNFLIKQVVEELKREFPNLGTFVTLSPLPGLRRWAEAAAEEGTLAPRLAATVEALNGAGAEPAAVTELAADYLMGGRGPRGGTRDPVGHFHLGNGARLEQIHPGADESKRGQAASWGVMVNYLYDLGTIEKNHETYSNTGEVMAAPPVRRVLKQR